MSQTQRQLRLGAIIQGVSSNMSAWRHHSGRVRGGTPTAFDDFVDQVIPLLQARGIYRTEYEGETLREHLGLAEPLNQFAVRKQQVHALSGGIY